MKKFVASLLFLTLLSANMSAQMLGLLKDSVHGPVKRVTAVLYTTNEPNVKWKDVAYYDRDGRQTEYYQYECNTLIWKCIYYYTESANFCKCELKASKDSDDSRIVMFDSIYRKIAAHSLTNGNHITGDSVVYDAQGHLVSEYKFPYKENTAILSKTYTYDSIGRLTGETDLLQKTSYTITYLPNGNYIKQFYENNKKKQKETYIFNKGLLFKIKTHDGEDTFINYDRYGNWGKRVFKFNKSSLSDLFGDSVTERTIEYYE